MTISRRGFLGVLGAATGWLATPASLRVLARPPAVAFAPVAVEWANYLRMSDLDFTTPISNVSGIMAYQLGQTIDDLVSEYIPFLGESQ